MLSGTLSVDASSDVATIVDVDKWRVVELDMSVKKLKWLWEQMNNFRTLFTDLTRGDLDSFVTIIMSPNTFCMEVQELDGTSVGVLYLTDIQLRTDASVHIIFFDRKPAEKALVCKLAVDWLFQNFPFVRLSAYVPSIYHSTLRLAKHIGFQVEGTRRQAYLIGNKWVDEVVLGILRNEVTK